MNKIRTLVAGAVGAAVIVAGSVASSPAQAQAQSILDIVAGSLADNPTPGSGTDNRWNDFDILANIVGPLGLLPTVQGLTNATAFAPADASFRGLVADLTNTPVWKLTEADVLNTLVGLTADAKIKSALATTVAYHVSPENITDLFKRRAAIPTLGGPEIRPIPLRVSAILRDGDKTDIDPFVVGGPIAASNGTVYVIAGVLRPIDLKVLFPLD
jgi:uncharacterized surface protein with fasciclin (FAS1) repeats